MCVDLNGKILADSANLTRAFLDSQSQKLSLARLAVWPLHVELPPSGT